MKLTKKAIAIVLSVVLGFTAVCPAIGAETADESATQEDVVMYDTPMASSTNNEQVSAVPETQDPFPDPEEEFKRMVYWQKALPRVWVGEYDGNDGDVPVRRKYAIQIQTITGNNVEGIGFVDKLEDKLHPEFQVRGSYYFKGTIDYGKKAIQFQGTEFLEEIDDFDFVTFTATIDDTLQKMTGSTTAYDGATVDLKATKKTDNYVCWDFDEDEWFTYKENEMNPKLALECMEDSLLIYGDSSESGTGYYSSSKKNGFRVLKNKLMREGFDSISGLQSSPKGDTTDCIHWAYAYTKLADDHELVYVILKGTTGDEWYGDFNLAGAGDTYEDESRHYSFHYATESLKRDLEKKLSEFKDKKITYVITGHSRGAASANILGKMLTDEKKEGDRVFCYTFATPTVVKNSLITEEYDNIFNFCLDDDFVTYMPLENSSWQYGRYGTTYHASAANLYKKNDYFRMIIRKYNNYTKGAGELSYKTKGAYTLADKLNQYCPSIEQFYIKDKTVITKKASWYDFFQNWFAPVLRGKVGTLVSRAPYYTNDEFRSIENILLGGGTGYAMENYSTAAHLGNTHDPKSYYAWMKCMADDDSVRSMTSELRDKLAKEYPQSMIIAMDRSETQADEGQADEYFDEEDVSALTEFANIEDNLEKLGWDPEAPDTWQGVTWNENGKVSELDLFALDLTGSLDVSSLDELEILDCGCNQLTNLIIGDDSLQELNCEGNFLELYPGSDLYNRITELDREGGFVGSYFPQCIRLEPNFSEEDLNKLRNLANTADNLDLLGWDLEKPAEFNGIYWTSVNGTYYVEKIALNGYGLTGEADLSGLDYLSEIDLGNNSINSVSVSDNSELECVDVSNNDIAEMSYDGCDNLKSLVCADNCLSESDTKAIMDSLGSQLVLLDLEDQRNIESADRFDREQLDILQDLLEDVDVEIDWNYPGANDRLKWALKDDRYVLSGIDLSETNISGEVDLTELKTIKNINFAYTDINKIILPSSISMIGSCAFAHCKELTDLYVSDEWNDVGTDAFMACDQLTIHCVRGSFAAFYCRAHEISFEEEVALDYIQIEGDSAKTIYKGEPFSLKESKLYAHYSDGSQKSIEEGYLVTGYDPNVLGKQTLLLSYSEENYTCELEVPVEVFGVIDGLVYSYQDDDSILIVNYIGTDESVVIPAQIEERSRINIGESAFYSKSIKEISFPETVNSIEQNAFKNCRSLTNVTFSDGLDFVGASAFEGCTSLKDAILPDTVTLMETSVFRDCSSLTKAHLPDIRVNIMDYTFYGCKMLEEVNIPSTVENIYNRAFAKCSALKEVVLPDGIKNIEDYAFAQCASLEKIVLPDSIESLGGYVFENCTSLKEAKLNEGRVNVVKGLFNGCTSLSTVYLPDSVEYIRESAFNNCSSLKEIDFPVTLKAIERNAFNNAANITPTYDGSIIQWHQIEVSESNNAPIFENYIQCKEPVSISETDIVLSPSSFTYDGSPKEPAASITCNGWELKEGTDFSVSYTNNTEAGTASADITGKGNFNGTVSKTYTILPKIQLGKTTRGDMFNLANNVKVTWKEVPEAKYYKVYREGITDPAETRKDPVIVTTGLVGWDKDPGLTNGHAYRYKIVASLTGKGDSSGDSKLSYSKVMYRLKTVVIRSVKNTAPDKVTVKYDKTTSGDSYVLQYCERQDMVGAKTKVVLGANNTSYVIGGLKKGKTYYISIRVRKKVNGIDYYTTFGVPKKVTVTK